MATPLRSAGISPKRYGSGSESLVRTLVVRPRSSDMDRRPTRGWRGCQGPSSKHADPPKSRDRRRIVVASRASGAALQRPVGCSSSTSGPNFSSSGMNATISVFGVGPADGVDASVHALPEVGMVPTGVHDPRPTGTHHDERESRLRLSISALPAFSALEEPVLIFDATDSAARDVHPLRGPAESRSFRAGSHLRRTRPRSESATVGPASGQRKRSEADHQSLSESYPPGDRPEVRPALPWLCSRYLASRSVWNPILRPTSDGVEEDLARYWRYCGAHTWPNCSARRLGELMSVRASFDVAIVHLPTCGLGVPCPDIFNAHDHLKAHGFDWLTFQLRS